MNKIALCFAFAVVCFGACNKQPEGVTVTEGAITQSVYATGVVKSRDQYFVYAPYAGILERVWVSEGDSVHPGSSLFTIANPALALATKAADATAAYNAVTANQDKLSELENSAMMALDKYQLDSALLARQAQLWSQNIGTKNDLDQRDLAAKTSLNAYKNALNKLSQLKKQLALAQIQAQTNQNITDQQANDLTVKSMLHGMVYNVLKSKGEMVTQQTPLAVVGKANDYYLELQVDEYDITQIALGQKVAITMDSHKGTVFEATVTHIVPVMNEKSKSFTIEASFAQQPPRLYPNLTAEANIIIQVKPKALLIPRACLLQNDSVQLTDGSTVKVSTGLKDYEKVEIISGLKAGEKIVKPQL